MLGEALQVTPEDDPDRAFYQLVLARTLALGYALGGRPDDLDDAVSQAELGSPADGGARLGHLLREQFLATGDAQSLHRAVRALEAAGIEAEDIALRRPTLDEVFLDLTGGDERTKEAA